MVAMLIGPMRGFNVSSSVCGLSAFYSAPAEDDFIGTIIVNGWYTPSAA